MGNRVSGKGPFVTGFIDKMPVVNQNLAVPRTLNETPPYSNSKEKFPLSRNINDYMCNKVDVVNHMKV